MFGLGWQEIAIVAVVLIIVVGPDDLPGLLRTLGRWIGNVQGLARDFRRQIDTMADDAGLAEEKKMFDQVRNLNPGKMVSDALDPTGEIKKDLQDTAQTTEEASVAARTESSLSKSLWKPENPPPPKPATPKASELKASAPKKAATKKKAAPKSAAKAKPKAAPKKAKTS